MANSLGFFANAGLNRAEKKALALDKRMPIEKLSKLYKTLSERLDDSEQAKLFARAANLMRQAGHPDKAFDFYMKAYDASKKVAPSNGQHYLASAIKAYPQHPNSKFIAEVLASGHSDKASKLADDQFARPSKERIADLLEAIFQYELAAETIAPFSAEQQLDYLVSARQIYHMLLKDLDYFSHFGNGQYLKLDTKAAALGERIAELGDAAAKSGAKPLTQPAGGVTVSV